MFGISQILTLSMLHLFVEGNVIFYFFIANIEETITSWLVLSADFTFTFLMGSSSEQNRKVSHIMLHPVLQSLWIIFITFLLTQHYFQQVNYAV
jgi:hypothetical protein